uniref:Uncharacterized protein n=1 Tax=Rhodnius prolixus TaxID=13249 RepID=A0A4P6D919_RHOPR
MGPSKTVLSTPSQNESSSSELATPRRSVMVNRLKFDNVIERPRSHLLLKECHLKRLKLLKKELDYLQETAWQYHPIETYIGH